MKRRTLVLIVLVIAALGGLISLSVFAQDKLYDQKEIASDRLRIRIRAYKENGVFIPGVYFVLQSAPVESDKWRNVITVKGDEPWPLRSEQLGFVAPDIGYGFIGGYYMVTLDAGSNWSIWQADKNLVSDDYQKQNNLAPFIEAIHLNTDGTGRMTLHKYFAALERGPDLHTLDFGLHWELTK